MGEAWNGLMDALGIFDGLAALLAYEAGIALAIFTPVIIIAGAFEGLKRIDAPEWVQNLLAIPIMLLPLGAALILISIF